MARAMPAPFSYGAPAAELLTSWDDLAQSQPLARHSFPSGERGDGLWRSYLEKIHWPRVDAPRSPFVVRGDDIADATYRAYSGTGRTFVSWCESGGVDPHKASGANVAAFLSGLFRAGRKPATIARARSALAYIFTASGFSDAENPALSQEAVAAQSDARKQSSCAPTKKAPATADRLGLMLAACGDDLAGLRNRALLALGFAGALRRSELVALTIEDIQTVEGGAVVTIRRSKTDQEGASQTIGILNGSRLRVLDHLRAWLDAAGITSGPIFRSVNKAGAAGAGLSDRSVADIVKATATRAGLAASDFAGHSLRSGFVCSGIDSGISAPTVSRFLCRQIPEGAAPPVPY